MINDLNELQLNNWSSLRSLIIGAHWSSKNFSIKSPPGTECQILCWEKSESMIIIHDYSLPIILVHWSLKIIDGHKNGHRLKILEHEDHWRPLKSDWSHILRGIGLKYLVQRPSLLHNYFAQTDRKTDRFVLTMYLFNFRKKDQKTTGTQKSVSSRKGLSVHLPLHKEVTKNRIIKVEIIEM